MREHDEASDALSEASAHVRERKAASEEAAERAKPKSSGTSLVIALMILAVVAAWDVYGLTRPPAGLPPAEQEADLSWFVVDAVELIEGYRGDEGRLPTAVELPDLAEEGLTYTPQGDAYVVVVESDDVRLVYDSSLSIDEWIAAHSLDAESEGGS